ncbi:Radical SAM protein [Candidatus Electronema halotolerans]
MNHEQAPQVFFTRTAAAAVQAQCDCACSLALPLPAAVLPPAADTLCQVDSSTVFLPLNADYQISLNRHSAIGLLNHPAAEMAAYFQNPHRLADIPAAWKDTWGAAAVQDTLAQMTAFNLLTPAACPQEPPAEIPDTLSVWLHLTDRCNLRCAYCYRPHQPLDMPPATGKAAIAATFRSAAAHQYCRVKLKYAGGEPLLCFPLAAELHQYAQDQAGRHGLELDGVILSNGTLLTEEIIELMQQLGLRLMISLDGLRDTPRCDAAGKDSAAAAMEAIELALSCGLTPDISVTVSKDSVDGLSELTQWLLARKLPFSFNFCRDNACAPTHATKLEEGRIISGMQAAFKVIEADLPDHSLLASLLDRADLSAAHKHACGAGSSYVVFDCAGQAHSCQMRMNRPLATAQDDNPLTLLRAAWPQHFSVAEKASCKNCAWKYWCAGGCPLAVTSSACPIYKALFPAVLRLEGLRLLDMLKKNGSKSEKVSFDHSLFTLAPLSAA